MPVITTSIEPIVTAEQLQALREHNARLVRQLEHHLPVERDVLSQMTKLLGQVVQQTPTWVDVLRQVHHSGDHHLARLLHDDNEVLNMPWGMATDPISNQSLSTIRRLLLAKCPKKLTGDGGSGQAVSLAPPLKVLVMISSPDDSEYDKRLSFEDEEFFILQAFSPLMESGQIEVDFTDDGSLESLERKLKANRYHILHVSCHAMFKDNQGKLRLEHPLSLKKQDATADEFAESLNCNPDYRVPLVVLSCCQSAQGNVEKGLSGVTNRLLQAGVQAVVGMGASVLDHYAALFAASFYGEIAQRQNVPAGFGQAVEFLRQCEYEDQVKAHVPNPQALQWIIPNLYLSSPLEHLVDWNKPQEKLKFSSHRYIVQNERIVLRHDPQFRFIGRRKDKARILPALYDGKPILLRGQGGVGKTVLAEHLIQRLIAANPRTQPFDFTETTRNIGDILDRLKNFLIRRNDFDLRAYDGLSKALEKLSHLVACVSKMCNPVFVFDNLETFQSSPGKAFKPDYEDIRDAISLICGMGIGHVILTARYPLPDFADVRAFDLNQVGLNDFWRKCHHLGLYRIAGWLHEQDPARTKTVPAGQARLQFIDVVKLLHETFGGNYRALEFFDQRFQQDPGTCREAIDSLEAFQAKYKKETDDVRQAMAQNLAFDSLLAMVQPQQLALLRSLEGFRIPVMPEAIRMQLEDAPEGISDTGTQLLRLQELTLAEISLDPEIDCVFYYVTPIVRDLLARAEAGGRPVPAAPISHQLAGAYHYHVFHNRISPTLTELEEAFFHFCEARNEGRVEEVGDQLSGFYHNVSLYRSALHYALEASKVLGEKTSPSLLNRLGMIYHLHGDYDTALEYLKRSLTILQEIGDRKGEGATLNNISQIYDAKGDYDTALEYLKRSLTIRQEIGDRSGEGTTLNNISTIYHAKGDYDTALEYLKRSLTILQEIGDRSGEGTTLNNISQIYKARGDYDTALEYLKRSLTISQEIGDRQGESVTLNNISNIYQARGDYDSALKYSQRDLAICQEIGDRKGEGTTLNNISQIYHAKGDYDTALEYLKRSLTIRQEIGDKKGESVTLNNISQIYEARGDYDTALKYSERDLAICQEIGDRAGMIATLHNMGSIAYAKQDMQQMMQYEMQAYAIAKETGDAMGLFNVGRIVGQILFAGGKKQEGLAVIRQSYEIGKRGGLPGTDELAELIRQMEQLP